MVNYMLYAIGKDKIIRADNDGNTVAEVHFIQKEPHVYEITEVLTASTDSDDPNLDKVMAKMVAHMRKNGNQVYTNDEFATEWFEDHPEARDILILNYHPSQKTYRQEEPTESAPQRKSAVSSRQPQPSYQESEEGGRNNLTSDDIPGAASRAISRILQILCAVVMLAILVVFSYAWVQNGTTQAQLLQDTTRGLSVFRSLCIGFIALLIVLFLWILSRKRYRVDGRKMRLDTGRGMIAFAILLIAVILGPTCLSYASSANAQATSQFEAIRGLAGFFTIYLVYDTYIALLSIVGLVMSIVRQFIGH